MGIEDYFKKANKKESTTAPAAPEPATKETARKPAAAKKTEVEPTSSSSETTKKTTRRKKVEDDDKDFVEEAEPPKKASKKTAEPSTDEPAPAPKKKNFYQQMNREGPRALNTRPLPVGKPNCFQGVTFVISGIMETMTKETVEDLIKRYGGRTTGSVSGKTTYLLRGRDSGEKKTRDANKHGTKILDEDDFYKLFETEGAKEVPKPVMETPKPAKGKGKAAATSSAKAPATNGQPGNMLWTEKYRPTTIKEIVGNKELVRKISAWLEMWDEYRQKNFKAPADVDGGIHQHRALLLSGPPGIGKTTTALVVARTHGYEPLEFNASDTRNKKRLQELLSPMVNNRSMTEFYHDTTNKASKEEEEKVSSGKVLLIMDEVDGMSGGDRGGSAELAALIRKTKVPVICICNDPRSDKVKPLLNVCFEAKYKRTPAAQLRSRLMTITYREGLRVEPNAIDQLVESSHNDLRQIINMLSTYKLSQDHLNYDQAKELGKSNEKYVIRNVFDIAMDLLTAGRWHALTLPQKTDLYFHDYSLSHLMMFENYLRVNPEKARILNKSGSPKEEQANAMRMAAKAADAMAEGDLVDSKIHGTVQQYSLMPVHSVMSCVVPAYYMEGSVNQKLFFPGWLGQNSKATKFKRLLTDMRSQMRLQTSANAYEIRENYVPTMTKRIFNYLANDETDEAIETMDSYYMQRDTLDTLNELCLEKKKPMSAMTTSQKTKFTRKYNERDHPVLFQTSEVIKKNVALPTEEPEGQIVEEESYFGEDVSEEEDEEEEGDVSQDKLIKSKKPSGKRKQKEQGGASRSKAKRKTK
ncbi:replication factor c subunit 1 [Lichtheimia corymbifera JMRC:FSU:9682]|uniref:Replication factor C subunit 1 n=1 Tax=Lichtheimia corymbifera JMRC:FSU:9682 TaxID=1263082 RepID=A0A068S501_9FUNG|nr:replication factor c subunit 1 [Lichtheimia corymbifera JMRC:FSU:9682]